MFRRYETLFFSKLKLSFKLYSNRRSCTVAIAGAIRTPFVSVDNLSGTQIAARTLDEVIKRAAITKENIDEVNLVGLNDVDIEQLRTECTQLHKNVRFEKTNDATVSFSNSISKLNAAQSKSVLICGVESAKLGNKYALTDKVASDLEIMPIFNRAKRCLVTGDEFVENKSVTVATAVALTPVRTNALAALTFASYNDKIATSYLVEEFLKSQGLQKQKIDRWEFLFSEYIGNLTELGLETTEVNCFSNILQHMPAVGPIILLTNVVHGLNPKQNAFVSISGKNNPITAMLLKKLPFASSENRPKLTLYTKNCCPLCDELVEELEQHFKDEYHLEKVFIDKVENARYLRLYRNDIPVLFLNDQFVCMHRLNKDLLRRMLSV